MVIIKTNQRVFNELFIFFIVFVIEVSVFIRCFCINLYLFSLLSLSTFFPLVVEQGIRAGTFTLSSIPSHVYNFFLLRKSIANFLGVCVSKLEHLASTSQVLAGIIVCTTLPNCFSIFEFILKRFENFSMLITSLTEISTLIVTLSSFKIIFFL